VLGDLREHVRKPGLTINAIELECLAEREHVCARHSDERMTEARDPSSGDDRNAMIAARMGDLVLGDARELRLQARPDDQRR
jgi:hypothetical protein